MCFGGGSSDSKIAKASRKDELARQARIASGMTDIAHTFDGTMAGSGAATAYDPTKTYYNADGSAYDRTASPGSVNFGPFGTYPIPGGTNPDNLIKAGKLFTGVSHTGGFGDDFYNKAKQSYIDYATPQLDRQAGDARDQMIYALSRTGNLDSSAALKKNSDLTRDTDQARLDIANQGLSQANAMRTNVEGVRSNLVAELNATGDSAAAAQGAIRQAQNLNAPQGMSPLGQLFSTFSSSLAGIGSNAGNGYSGLARNPQALFGSNSSSQRTVN